MHRAALLALVVAACAPASARNALDLPVTRPAAGVLPGPGRPAPPAPSDDAGHTGLGPREAVDSAG